MDDPARGIRRHICHRISLGARRLAANIQLRRETRLRWIQVGGQIEERVTLSNGFSFPAAWVEFIDQSTLPGFNANRSTSINAGYFDQWTFTATCTQRGLFYLGGAKILTGDPFGIFEVSHPRIRSDLDPGPAPNSDIYPNCRLRHPARLAMVNRGETRLRKRSMQPLCGNMCMATACA